MTQQNEGINIVIKRGKIEDRTQNHCVPGYEFNVRKEIIDTPYVLKRFG